MILTHFFIKAMMKNSSEEFKRDFGIFMIFGLIGMLELVGYTVGIISLVRLFL